ncbi:hypothetical protein BX666DRAFT_1863745, partial [Dichotomocladium elegans]
LIDAFKASWCCPDCEADSLRTFKEVPNPLPVRRVHEERKCTHVIFHGFLRVHISFHLCINRSSAENGTQPRLWNRDMAASLNMHHIIRGLHSQGSIPKDFADEP